jgi:hypothetical protein
MGATNLLVIGSGVNAASIDDALLQHNLSVDNFIVYGHFGVHRVITLYATKNKLGFIRVTQKTCMDRARAESSPRRGASATARWTAAAGR